MTRVVRDVAALRAYLRLVGLSQRGLAVRAEVAPATVNHLLSGRRTTCTDETASAIEAVLECPSGVFFAPVVAANGRRGAVLATSTWPR